MTTFLQGVLGVAVLLGYFLVESKGMIFFSGSDSRPNPSVVSGGRRSGGGPVFWGTGFHGGK